MINILLVDDEDLSIQGMKNLVPWDQWQCRIAAVANNGKSALDIINSREIDIVFTDIKMPEMDGLQLIQEAKKVKQDINFIIITGYSEFDYAQKAVKYGVKNYLLKPVGITEVEETLLSLKDLYPQEDQSQRDLSSSNVSDIKRQIDMEPFIEGILVSVAQKNWNKISEVLLSFFKEIRGQYGSLEHIRYHAIKLLSSLIKKEIIYSNDATLFLAGEIGSANSQSGIYNILKDQIMLSQNRNGSSQNKKMNPHIQKILIYLLTHYKDKNLTLKWLSENVTFVNPDYLGKLFASETGKNFASYLTEFRIARAVEYLRDDSRIPIQDLAALVGYPDNVSYFIRQYKKITGMTPAEFAASTVVHT